EEFAWPLLQRYGFGATVFVVSGSVGRWNTWDALGSAEPLMDWPAIRQLSRDGVEIGAHTVRHHRLTALPAVEAFSEALGSRAALEAQLDAPVVAFAFPFGDYDAGTMHLVGAAGFTYAVTCHAGLATWQSDFLSLPRFEVRG